MFSVRDDLDRFMAKVEEDSEFGCWRWTGATSRYGHGMFKYGGSMRSAHRWSWQHRYGPLDPGLHLDHYRWPGRCIGPGCVNPEHVRPVSPRENALRGDTVAARRLAQTHCVNGHEFTPENTIVRADGRRCLECHRVSARAQVARRVPHPVAPRSHCVNGHEFTDGNTWVDKTGSRHCRTCNRERARARRRQ